MGAIPPVPAPDVIQVGGWESGSGLLNRELSWLAFDARVLALAADASQPLFERVKFCAIFSSNLDEFFQVRVAGLADQVAAGDDAVSPDGRSASVQLREVRSVVEGLLRQQSRLVQEELLTALEAEGIRVVCWDALTDAQRIEQAAFFRTRIFPVLTPLAVDPGHPFPYISDLSLNLAVMLRDPITGRTLFARVKVPSPLPRFLAVGDSGDFLALEDLIAAQLPVLFPGLEVLEHHVFRVTRNADLSLREGEAEDLLAAVETELRRRRFGRAVRLEVAGTMSLGVRELLARELDLGPDEVYDITGLVDATGLLSLTETRRSDLGDPPWQGITDPAFLPAGDEPLDLFARLRAGDVLVHHPYTSFATSVVAFIQAAADDSEVLAIKITLYRTSGDSPIIEALVHAAEKGKQVAVLVELKARFDERSNIESARRLEQSGVHVAYGLVGYKIHSKVCLVIREEADGIRRYCHIGTGNYNPRTARLYEDIGLFTADPDIGEDCTHLFNSLTGYGRAVTYRRLLVAPESLRAELLARIENEIAHRGRIAMKMNSLVDPEFIALLTRASQAGVEIDLLVRGICCLRPGVPGLTETIRVRSIVGRFLEHSRVYVFANGRGPGLPEHLIGSADLMPRNLDRRVEVLVPVVDPDLVARIDDILRVGFLDDTLAWELDGAGAWTRATGGTHDSQLELQRLALGRAANAYGADRR